MLKTLLASTLILAAALPARAQVGPGFYGTDYINSYSGNSQPARVCTNDPNGRLSLRTGPGQNFPKIKEIPNGNTIALISREYNSKDNFLWWQVSHNGSFGWVRADYVCGGAMSF